MAIVATKTVTFTGDAAENGDTYEWIATWVGPTGWVTPTQTTSNVWEFDADDFTTGTPGETREVTFSLRHHLYGSNPNDPNLEQSFTIIQHNEANQ